MAGEIVGSVEMLRRLVAFDTTSRNSNLALIEYVQKYLQEHGIASKLVPSEDGKKANLFATVGPNVKDGVVLSGHTDVVPVDGQPWDTDPWTLTLKDGKYYGRGTCDMKAFYAIGLAMLPEFKKAKLKKPIHFALSYDEEVAASAPMASAARMASEGAEAARHHHRRADHDDGGPRPQGRADLHHQVHRLRGALLDDPSRRQRHPFRRRVHPLPQQGAGRARGQGAQEQRVHAGGRHLQCRHHLGGTAGNILARECEVLWGYRELPTEPIEALGNRALNGWRRSCCPG
jgi:acetylornithine deacetylase